MWISYLYRCISEHKHIAMRIEENAWRRNASEPLKYATHMFLMPNIWQFSFAILNRSNVCFDAKFFSAVHSIGLNSRRITSSQSENSSSAKFPNILSFLR